MTKKHRSESSRGISSLVIIGLVVLTVVVSAVGFVVFQRFGSKTIQTADGTVKVNKNGDLDLSSENVDAKVGENLKLPADFPKELPIYPKLSIKSYVYNTPEKLVEVIGNVDADQKSVTSWFKDYAKKNNWALEMEAPGALIYTNADKMINIGITENGTSSGVSVTMLPKEEWSGMNNNGQSFDESMKTQKTMIKETKEEYPDQATDVNVYEGSTGFDESTNVEYSE